MIDEDVDWCSRASKLRQVEEAILTGEMITEARFGSDMTRFASTDLGEVRKALAEAQANCAVLIGGPKPRRRRYAIRGAFRTY